MWSATVWVDGDALLLGGAPFRAPGLRDRESREGGSVVASLPAAGMLAEAEWRLEDAVLSFPEAMLEVPGFEGVAGASRIAGGLLPACDGWASFRLPGLPAVREPWSPSWPAEGPASAAVAIGWSMLRWRTQLFRLAMPRRTRLGTANKSRTSVDRDTVSHMSVPGVHMPPKGYLSWNTDAT